MSRDLFFLAMLSPLVVHIPTIVVLLVGIILTLRRRSGPRRHAPLALAGFLCLLVSVLVITPLGFWANWAAYERTASAQVVGTVSTVSRTFQSVIAAVGIGLLIAAVFARQGNAAERTAASGEGGV